MCARLWRADARAQGVGWRAQRAVPTSTDPMGILKITREFKAPGAGKEHTSAVRGGGRDPGVRRPGSFGRQVSVVIHKKMFWFKCYPHKSVLLLKYPQKTVIV